jgi:Rha family phage regulatory protein
MLKNLVMHPKYLLYERKGRSFCSSLQVAETFKKEHKNVLRDIEQKILSVAPESFCRLNFELTSQTVDMPNGGTRKEKMYLMTRDGFAFLAMGFTGKKAAVFKVAYINRFNQMEAFIKENYATRMEFPQFTEAVMMAHEEPKTYHYSNECDLINRIVIGIPAKVFRETNGIKAGESIRPYLTAFQNADIRALQMADIGLLASGVAFQERKKILAGYHDRRKIIELSA